MQAFDSHTVYSRRDTLRRATQSQHDLAEAQWANAGRWQRAHYITFLGKLLDAHRRFGHPAALRLGRDQRLEATRLDALFQDLDQDMAKHPETPDETLPCKSAAWGASYVLNGSAMGASIMIKSGMVPPDWPQAYLRLGRSYAAGGGLRRFFNDLESADLDMTRAIDGARRCFALFTSEPQTAGTGPESVCTT